LDAGQTNFFCKENLSLRNQKKRKPDAIRQNLLRKVMAQMGCFAADDDDDDGQVLII
jgi:hypothetical protein